MIATRSRSLQSPKHLEKKRKKFIGIIIICVFAVALFLIGIVLLLRVPFLQIMTVEVRGTVTVAKEEVEKIALKVLGDEYVNVIPASSIFFYPEEKIKRLVTESIKDIDSISIKKGGFSKLVILVHERVPAVLVCEGFHEENPEDEECFFADQGGYVFAKAPHFSSGTYSRYYVSADKGDAIVGTVFMDKDEFNHLQKFADGVTRVGISFAGILVNEGGRYEMYIQNKVSTIRNSTSTTSEAIVYFDNKNSFEDTLSNFLAFWQNATLKATTTPQYEYINLRYGKNIFYSTK